jgi:hypothetical protein
MKINVVNIEKGNVMFVKHSRPQWGSARDVEKYADRVTKFLREAFGCQIYFLPCSDEWDFTIIKRPPTKKVKKVARSR